MKHVGEILNMTRLEGVHNKNCYGCGRNNPIGLKILFNTKDGCVIAEFHSTKDHEGPPGLVHGGVIGVVADESSSYLARQLTGESVRTAKQEIRFRGSAKLGEVVYAESRLARYKGRVIIVTSKVFVEDRIIAEVKSLLFKQARPEYGPTS
jgi:acyl-coenzyme A thioesterase PaaI-like protein